MYTLGVKKEKKSRRMGRRGWITLGGLLMGSGVLVGGLRPWIVPSKEVTVRAVRLPPGFIFFSESPGNEKLQHFRHEQHLDALLRGRKSELDRLSRLAQWTANLFPETTPFPNYPPWDAEIILERIRSHQTGGFCAQYAIIFGQACQSFGYEVRYVDLAAPRNLAGHFVTSVYLPRESRWVAFDASRGSYFRDERGAPLSVLDLHEQAVGQRQGTVFEEPAHRPVSPEYLRFYFYLRYYLRNNFLTVPVFLRYEGSHLLFEPYRLSWKDRYTRGLSEQIDSFWANQWKDFDFKADWTKRSRVVCRTLGDLRSFAAYAPPLQVFDLQVPNAILVRFIREDLIARAEKHPAPI